MIFLVWFSARFLQTLASATPPNAQLEYRIARSLPIRGTLSRTKIASVRRTSDGTDARRRCQAPKERGRTKHNDLKRLTQVFFARTRNTGYNVGKCTMYAWENVGATKDMKRHKQFPPFFTADLDIRRQSGQ